MYLLSVADGRVAGGDEAKINVGDEANLSGGGTDDEASGRGADDEANGRGVGDEAKR